MLLCHTDAALVAGTEGGCSLDDVDPARKRVSVSKSHCAKCYLVHYLHDFIPFIRFPLFY